MTKLNIKNQILKTQIKNIKMTRCGLFIFNMYFWFLVFGFLFISNGIT